jgi:hypothetical protein
MKIIKSILLTIKKTLVIIWLIWIVLLIGVMLFHSGPIDLNITNTIAATWIFYGLTFGLPLILGLASSLNTKSSNT